jgi:hypothetical protein
MGVGGSADAVHTRLEALAEEGIQVLEHASLLMVHSYPKLMFRTTRAGRDALRSGHGAMSVL